MTFSLLWLPQVLREAGLTVDEVPGWQNRGHGDEGNVLGVLCHHTCGPLHGEMPDLSVIVNGRPDLGGPLAQLALGRTGIFHIVAAGKCWHAGRGEWQGITDGNAHLIGIEAENIGTSDKQGHPLEPWPDVQMDAYTRGVAAILKHIGAKPIMCAGHKEFALPHGRKDDPNFDMDKFRADVAVLMEMPTQTAARPAVSEPTKSYDPNTSIEWVQQALNRWRPALALKIDGLIKKDGPTFTAVEAFQANHSLQVDGVPGHDTRTALRLFV